MRYSSGSQTALNHENLWKKLLIAMVRITVVYSIVSISIIALSFRFVVPFFKENLPHFWASLVGMRSLLFYVLLLFACYYGEEKSFGRVCDFVA